MNLKSVKSSNPRKSVIQTNPDIVKAHGGEIRADSELGKGTIMTIQFLNI